MARLPVLVSLLYSVFFSGNKFCFILISWFLLVPARVLVLVSLLLSSLFSPDRGSVPPTSGSDARPCVHSSLFCFSFSGLVCLLRSSFFSREINVLPL